MNINFDIKLTKKQQEVYDLIHNEDTRYLVVRFSRQCGKSVCAEVLLIEYLLKSGSFNAYISPTFAQGQKVYKEIVKILQPTGLLKSANASLMQIESIYGGVIQFFSVQSYNAIRGNTIKGLLVIDEAAFIPDTLSDGSDAWSNVIYPIVKANIKRNKILIISTPKGKRGMFWKSYNNALSKLNGWYEVCATIYDDELISREDIEELKNSMSPMAFKEEFMVEFLENSVSFFQGFTECFSDYQYDENVEQFIGIDPSGDGQDDFCLTKINKKGQTKQYVISGSLDSKYIQCANIINNTKNLKGVLIEINGLGAPIYNEIKKLVKNKSLLKEWITTNDTKVEILGDLALDIVKKNISFHNDNTKLKSQFNTFGSKYTKSGKIQLIGLNGTHDDCILSLGIANHCKNISNIRGTYTISFN